MAAIQVGLEVVGFEDSKPNEAGEAKLEKGNGAACEGRNWKLREWV